MLKPTALAAWSRASSRNATTSADVVALHDAIAEPAEDERDRGGDAGAARQPEREQPDPAALQQPLESGFSMGASMALKRLRTRVHARRHAAGRRARAQPRDQVSD